MDKESCETTGCLALSPLRGRGSLGEEVNFSARLNH